MAHRKIDVVGKKFGKFEVLEEMSVPCLVPKEKRKSTLKLKVKCECGGIFLIDKGNILYGRSTQCQSCALKGEWPFKTRGKLTILRTIPRHEIPNKNIPGIFYECKCICGNQFITSRNTLRKLQGYYCRACKPIKRKKLSIKESNKKNNYLKHLKSKERKIGTTFGYLTILSFHDWMKTKTRRYPIYKCKCKCKKIIYVRGDLTNIIKSCGCFRKDNAKRGEDSPVAKLKNIEIKSIQELSNSGLYTRQEIAKIYNISYEYTCSLISKNIKTDSPTQDK